MGLKNINLKEEYRSDVDDIVAEFFFPCLSNCIEYDRCVNYLSNMKKTTTHDCEIVGELNQMTNSRWEHLKLIYKLLP